MRRARGASSPKASSLSVRPTVATHLRELPSLVSTRDHLSRGLWPKLLPDSVSPAPNLLEGELASSLSLRLELLSQAVRHSDSRATLLPPPPIATPPQTGRRPSSPQGELFLAPSALDWLPLLEEAPSLLVFFRSSNRTVGRATSDFTQSSLNLDRKGSLFSAVSASSRETSLHSAKPSLLKTW